MYIYIKFKILKLYFLASPSMISQFHEIVLANGKVLAIIMEVLVRYHTHGNIKNRDEISTIIHVIMKL